LRPESASSSFAADFSIRYQDAAVKFLTNGRSRALHCNRCVLAGQGQRTDERGDARPNGKNIVVAPTCGTARFQSFARSKIVAIWPRWVSGGRPEAPRPGRNQLRSPPEARRSDPTKARHFADKFEINPHPSNLRSGWLPHFGRPSLKIFFETMLNAPRKPQTPSVQAMAEFIDANPVLRYMIGAACKENENTIAYARDPSDVVNVPRIANSSFAVLYQKLPDKELIFVDDDGVPYPHPVPPTGSSSTGGAPTNIGAQIGVWYDKNKRARTGETPPCA